MIRSPLAALLIAALLLPALADAAKRKTPPKKPAAAAKASRPVVGAQLYGPREDVRAFAAAVAEKRGWRDVVLRWRHKDGSIRYLESTALPLFDAAG